MAMFKPSQSHSGGVIVKLYTSNIAQELRFLTGQEVYIFSIYITEALPRGGPRSLVGILKCLVSAFFQGFTSLSAIKRQAFVFVGVLVNK